MTIVDLVKAAEQALIAFEQRLSRQHTKPVLLPIAEQSVGFTRARLTKANAREIAAGFERHVHKRQNRAIENVLVAACGVEGAVEFEFVFLEQRRAVD